MPDGQAFNRTNRHAMHGDLTDPWRAGCPCQPDSLLRFPIGDMSDFCLVDVGILADEIQASRLA